MADTTSHQKKTRTSSTHVSARPIKLSQDLTYNQQEARIDIVPLMDVIFCILTFFILGAVGLSRQQAINLDLPKASTGTPQMREMLVVSLDDYGQVYVEQQLVTQNQLYDSIRTYHQYNPKGLMVLHASRNTSYNEVIKVLDMLKEVGGDRVALATLPGETGNTNNQLPSTNTNPLPNNSLPNNWQQPVTPNPNLNQPSNSSNPLLPGVPSAPSTSPNGQ